MRYYFLIGVFTALSARAQDGQLNYTTRDRINFSGLVIPATGVLFGIEGERGKLLGDTYYDTTFQAGNLRFYGRIGATDSLGGVPLRYDLLNQEVEIRAAPRDIRAAKAPQVRSFALNNRQGGISRFLNVREYRSDADGLLGFFELKADGKLQLLQRHTVILKRANYNAALNVGTKDDELVKKQEWFIGRQGQAKRFVPGKKDLLRLMADRRPALETYLQTQQPDLRKEAGLLALFAYYNSL